MMTQTVSSPLEELVENAPKHWVNMGQLELVYREEALQKLNEVGLPHAKTEWYKNSPIPRNLNNWLEGSNATDSKSEINKLPLEASHWVFVNGQFHASQSSIHESHKGLVPNKLADDQFVGADFTDKDALFLLNRVLNSSSYQINIPSNTKIDQPIAVYILGGNGNSLSNTYFKVNVGKHAEATLIVHPVGQEIDQPMNVVIEAELEENSRLKWIQAETDLKNSLVQHSHVNIHKGSRLDAYCFSLDGTLTRHDFRINMLESTAEALLNGLYLCKNKASIDYHTTVDHKAAHTHSDQLFKVIAEDEAIGIFNGRVFVRPDAQKITAYQSNKNLLLSDSAKIFTKPQLEIWADDVKCSHGATTGQLDEEALFYLQARGIDKASAKVLLLQAFGLDVIASLKEEPIKEFLVQELFKHIK